MNIFRIQKILKTGSLPTISYNNPSGFFSHKSDTTELAVQTHCKRNNWSRRNCRRSRPCRCRWSRRSGSGRWRTWTGSGGPTGGYGCGSDRRHGARRCRPCTRPPRCRTRRPAGTGRCCIWTLPPGTLQFVVSLVCYFFLLRKGEIVQVQGLVLFDGSMGDLFGLKMV